MRRHLCVCRDLEGPRASKNKECGPAVVHRSCLHTLKIRPPAFMDVLSSGCSNGKTSLRNSTSVTSRQKKKTEKTRQIKTLGEKKCSWHLLNGI